MASAPDDVPLVDDVGGTLRSRDAARSALAVGSCAGRQQGLSASRLDTTGARIPIPSVAASPARPLPRPCGVTANYVDIPVGGAGTSLISLICVGSHPDGGQVPRSKTQIISDPGRAALGASSPAQPARQSVSPNVLVRRPASSRRGLRRGEADGGQSFGAAEIGEFEFDPPQVLVVRDGARRR
jgi:hypothetical protein